MPHGMKITKLYREQPTGVPNIPVDFGFPNNGLPDNGYNIARPGVTGSRNSTAAANPVTGVRFIASGSFTGSGTITASTASATVTFTSQVGPNFGSSLSAGDTLYVNGVLLGTVLSVVDGATTCTLTANAAFNVTNSAYTVGTAPGTAWMVSSKGKSVFLLGLRNVYIRGCYAQRGDTYVVYAYQPYITELYPPWTILPEYPEGTNGGRFTALNSGTQLDAVPPGSENLVLIGVTQCRLVDKASSALLPGEAVLVATKGDATTFNVAKMIGAFVWDFSGNKYIATLTGASSTIDPATGLEQVSLPYWS